MSVLPRMKLKNKIADMWIDWPSIGMIACRRFESDCLGRKTELQPMTLTPEVTIVNYRAPSRISITLSPPSEESSERHVPEMCRCAMEYYQSGSFADPNSRLQN